ncbi:hypothetical protein [Microcoleus sp.]|uniref:hypothetical protein n=1 Tax=Microcoleus sp. TaxID=44472 RepID=UPI00403EB8BB
MASGKVGNGDVFGHLIEGAIAPFKASGCRATALKGAIASTKLGSGTIPYHQRASRGF